MMRNRFSKCTALILAVLLFTPALAGCGSKNDKAAPDKAEPDKTELADCAVSHDHEFGSVFIEISIDDFNALGFEFGDSVDVAFSNGYEVTDIPYYNGYYCQIGGMLLVGYPGEEFIKAAINIGDCMWDVAGLNEGDLATVTLNEHGKYLDVQEARNIQYTDDYDDYGDDEVFANFRNVKAGGIAPERLFRSASPCDNQHNRAPYANDLIEAAGVQCIVNLADDDEKIKGYMEAPDFDSPYFKGLYENGAVIPLALNMNYTSDEFKEKLAAGLTAMAEKEGPYLVHCTEGKDRTGFVCALLEALCGADYDEIVADYMITFDNYYGISKESDPDRYNIIVESLLEPMLETITEGTAEADGAARSDAAGGDGTAEAAGDAAGSDAAGADLAAGAENYLKAAGMTDEAIAKLKAQLM